MTQDRDPIAIARAALELVAQEREQARFRPLAKASASLVDRHRCIAHADFVHAVDQLERRGVSHSDIARDLDVNRSTVSTWFHYGFTARNQIPAYALVAVQAMLVETLAMTGTR